MRYRLIVEYDGTRFHGWQLQPKARSVQQVLEEAGARLFGTPVRMAAAGRTDAGVHATGQVVSFSVAEGKPAAIVQRALQALTPDDVAVRTAEVVEDDFDPRRHASGRTYEYHLWNASVPSPFWRRYAWQVPVSLDLEAMQEGAAALLGEHDFSSFRAARCEAESPVRRVDESVWQATGERLVFRIRATAFLHHMVRNIVGTLVQVGRGDRPADSIPALLAARDRRQAGGTAPPHGLFLTEVHYGGRDRPPGDQKR